jgi:AcrR family transcriptional regulator
VTETSRAQRTAAELKAATRRLLASKTYAEIKITDITEEAGRAAGSFYRHFADKDTLLKALVGDFETALREQVVHSAGHDHELTGREDVRRHVHAYWQTYRDHQPEMTGIFQASMLNSEFREIHTRLRERQVDVWAAHLAETHGDDARTTALGIVCMLEYFCYDRLSSRRRLNDKNIVDTLTDLIAGGVLGRRDRP